MGVVSNCFPFPRRDYSCSPFALQGRLALYSHDDRYAPYDKLVEASGSVVYVTTQHPVLDQLLRERFSSLGVRFREKQIGDYHVLYDLSRKVTPEELDIVHR